MNKRKISRRIVNCICILLVFVMVGLLFTPYWQYETTEKIDGKKVPVTKEVSINGYVWIPKNHADLTKQFKAAAENPKDYKTGDMVAAPVFVLLFGVVLGIVSLFVTKLPLSAVLTLVLGGMNAYSFLKVPEMQSGMNRDLQLTFSVIAAAVGLVALVWFVIDLIIGVKKKEIVLIERIRLS